MIRQRLVTDGLATMLSAVTQFEITAIEAPDPVPTDKPYGIVDPITGGDLPDEGMDGTYYTKNLTYQVSCIGASYDQAQALMDLVEAVVLNNKTYPLSTADGFTTRRERDMGPSTPQFSPAKDECMVASRYTLFMAAI